MAAFHFILGINDLSKLSPLCALQGIQSCRPTLWILLL